MMLVKSIQFKQEFDEPIRSSPEERLWRAVIYSAVEDAESYLRAASRMQDEFRSVSQGYFYEMKKIDMQVESDWFDEICLAVDVDRGHIVRLIDRCKEKYQFHKMTFVDRVFALDSFAEKYKGTKKRYKSSEIK